MSTDPYRLASLAADFKDRIFTDITVDASPAAAAETIIATVGPISPLRADQSVVIFGWCSYTVGTSGVSGRLRIRRTDASGATKADTGLLTRTAGNLVDDSIIAVDALGAVGNQVYVMTLTIGSGAAASTVSAVALVAVIV
jgi:hypothetical protein